MSTREQGNFGENLAVKYLLKNNYQILAKNYKKKTGEIDVVALDEKGVVIFFEVKARESEKFGEPEEAVTLAKQQKIIRTAQWFLKEHKLENQKFRIDVLAIKLDNMRKMAKIRHIFNAIGEKTHDYKIS